MDIFVEPSESKSAPHYLGMSGREATYLSEVALSKITLCCALSLTFPLLLLKWSDFSVSTDRGGGEEGVMRMWVR